MNNFVFGADYYTDTFCVHQDLKSAIFKLLIFCSNYLVYTDFYRLEMNPGELWLRIYWHRKYYDIPLPRFVSSRTGILVN